MKKNAFTLIELLAVITIIALLSTLIIPNISKNIRDKKNEISEVNQKLLSSATELYIESNPQKYNKNYEADGSIYCIPVQTLINSGILETPFKDVSGTEIDYAKQVKATYEAQYNSFSYELVDPSECHELIQYISRPVLAQNMIPVIYDSNTSKWVKADQNSHWYNYTEKRWANAVLVKEQKETTDSKSRYEYKEAAPGTPILDDDILAQFVWIPRFRYQIFESNTQIPINIVFEDIATTKSSGLVSTQWLTHPAFTNNNQELSGIWIGKYETSNLNDNTIIKNQTPWTNVGYVDANEAAIAMTKENNVYGLKNVSTHMTKNSEWGALAYLTNSIYGNLENNTTTGNITGIYGITGNKEFVIIDNESENSLGYALNETKTWTTNNSYITTENPYLTRGNNSLFNYQNSNIVDADTTFRISLTNIQAQDQNYKNVFVVSFDPNGGILTETTRQVTHGTQYGTLPIPTKEGYTFMGWNGKNLFNKDDTPINTSLYIKGDGTTASNSEYSVYQVNVKPNTTYTITNSGKSSAPGYVIYNSGGTRLDGANYGNNAKITFTTPATASYIKVSIVTKEDSYRYDKNSFQLEEGSIATLYEPYYVTSDIQVTQLKDHTLKAIWQAN